MVPSAENDGACGCGCILVSRTNPNRKSRKTLDLHPKLLCATKLDDLAKCVIKNNRHARKYKQLNERMNVLIAVIAIFTLAAEEGEAGADCL